MEGFIADSTFNIISATLDEKSFDRKTLTPPTFHLCPLQIEIKKSMRVERYETNDGVNPAENDCIEIGAASLHYLPLGWSEGLGLFTLYFYNIALRETSEGNGEAK